MADDRTSGIGGDANDVEPYLECMAGVTLPTDEQTLEFADYVAGAHSWYKHLPSLPPGREFLFFLNPNSGRDRAAEGSGLPMFVDRTEGTPFKFHYTWMTTARYRERFGFWDYFQGGSPVFVLLSISAEGMQPTLQVSDHRALFHPRHGTVALPRPVAARSTCALTAWVHKFAHQWGPYAFRELDDFENYRRARPDDPDVLRFEPMVAAMRDVHEVTRTYRTGSGYTPEQERALQERVARLDGLTEQFFPSERERMLRRIRDTLFAARDATRAFLGMHGRA